MNNFIKFAQAWGNNIESQKAAVEIIEKFQLLLFNGKLQENKIINITELKDKKVYIVLVNRPNNNFIQKQESLVSSKEDIKVFLNINAMCGKIKENQLSWFDMSRLFEKYKLSIVKKNNKIQNLKISLAKAIQEYFSELVNLIFEICN